ncbi:MAG: hypothetical protein KDB53_06480, partial [Planctomycetes bacterium]|nr:hypothetical protein [Planctomycetota bacterium]
MNRRNLQIESETEGQPAATRNGPLAAGPKSGIKASQKDLGPGVLGEQRMKSDQATVLRPASGELGMPRLSDANGSEAALRVGVIMGLGYRNLRGDLERLSRYLTGTPIPHHVVREPSDVDAAMREFEAQGLDVVVVSGGDGTVSMVTTWMLTRRSKIPYMAILEGGRTNMTARDVGLRGDQIKRLHRLLNWADEGGRKKHEVLTREALSVSVGSRPTECGFFVGGGAVYQGSLATWNFRDRSRMGFMRTGVGTGASVVKLMTRHLIS